MDSFSDDEKRFILAEMIKTSTVDIHDMVAFLKSRDIAPDWEEMQVPRGRNLKQCKEAALVLGISVPPQVLWNQQPHSLAPNRLQPPIQQKVRQPQYSLQEQHNNNHLNTQTHPPLKTESKKRKSSVDPTEQPSKRVVLPSLETHSAPRLRELKPKASEIDISFDASPTPKQRASAPPQNGQRKRGRPPNASHARASLAVAPAPAVALLTAAPEANEPTPIAPSTSLSRTALASQADSPIRRPSSEDAEEKNIRDSSSYSERSPARA